MRKKVFTEAELEEFSRLVTSGVAKQEVRIKFDISDTKIEKMCKELDIHPVWLQRCRCVCVVCGKEFRATRKTIICPECKDTPATCVICGKQFERKYFPYTQKTCSAACRGKYRAESGAAKAGARKMLKTKFDRYGTVDPAEVTKQRKGGELDPKICPLCNKEFIPDTPRQVYCKDIHYVPCPVCGKLTELKDVSAGPSACSEKCRMARINATCLEKYGNKDAVNSDHAKKLAKIHSLERYGKEYYAQTEEAKERFRQASREKYGTDNPMQNKDIQDKAKATNKERYGVEYYMQTEEGRQKAANTMEERYGGIGYASPEISEKIKETNRQKYGVDYPMESAEISAKAAASLRQRYGVSNFWQSIDHLKQIIIDPSKAEEFYAFKQDPRSYIESHYDKRPTAKQLAEDLGVSDTPIYDALLRADSSDAIAAGKRSTMEWQVLDFLKEIVPDAKIQINTRRVISPLELDFYLPEFEFAIECNPTETHQSSVIDTWGCDPKPYNYHLNKTNLCEEKGVFLFHIFGYEWTHRRDVIKSMIANILKCSKTTYYARKTKVIELDSHACGEFLDVNHRQGKCISPIRLGLQYVTSGELVSVMTFGKMRSTIGQLNAADNDYELVRFCNLLNTNVVGGASKLFKHFINNYRPHKVVSFSDRAHTKGNLYNTLGFVEVSRSDPGYVWVRQYYDTYRSRVSCQKHHLIKMFEDVTEETLIDYSEREIMIDHGYVQVFDSGVIRWEYTPS